MIVETLEDPKDLRPDMAVLRPEVGGKVWVWQSALRVSRRAGGYFIDSVWYPDRAVHVLMGPALGI